MKLQYKTLIWKLIFLLFLWFNIDLIIWYENKINIIEKEYTILLEEKNEKIISYQKDREKYKATLLEIIDKIYKDESYISIGGIDNSTVKDESIDDLISSIRNYTEDFTDFLNNVENFFDKRNEYLQNIPNIFPVYYSKEVRITSGFGNRVYPFTNEIFFHKGIDITGKDKTPIISTADGVVTDVWIYHRVYGKMVKIKHNGGFTTLYAHMDKTRVKEGQKVKRGQIIGYMGNTGKSYGIHLHYEVEKDGQLVNPIDYLSSHKIILSK